ncbi:MAG: sensor histidine kinase [Alphaproteobacteria bacterium]
MDNRRATTSIRYPAEPSVKAGGSDFGRLHRFFGRAGIAGTTALLTLFAIVAAEALHFAISALRGHPLDRAMVLEIAGVAALVSAPVIVYAQRIIRKLALARRAEKAAIARLAQALDATEQADRSKTHFLANMSHELRTPLNAVIGFSELIRDQHFGPIANPRYVAYAGDINDSAQHLLAIIDDVLDLSRIMAGHRTVPDDSVFALDQALDATLRMVERAAADKGVTIATAPRCDGLHLSAPERLLRQALLNVVGNAVKFTPQGGRVTLDVAHRPDGALAIGIADTGPGMTASEIAVALTPFGRIDDPFGSRHPGTGLGLPLAKAMMEMQDGALHVESKPGRGTRVELRFPPQRVQIRLPARDAA